MKRNYAEIKVADAGFYHWYFGYETECDGDYLSVSVNLEEAEKG